MNGLNSTDIDSDYGTKKEFPNTRLNIQSNNEFSESELFLYQKNKALSTIKIIHEEDDDVIVIQRSPTTYQKEDKKYQRFNDNVILVGQKTSEYDYSETKSILNFLISM